MPKIMLINVTHAEESRVGIITDGVLSSFEIESFSREHLKGNIYRGVISRIHPALEAAFVDIGAERNAFLPLDEICFRNLPNPVPKQEAAEEGKESGNGNGNGNGRRRSVRIQDILKPGDEILVQIVKEEFANKPPTLSTFYSLPGRYLVLLPGSEDAGISRRIEGDDRQRIRDLIERLAPPPGFGIIVRTAAGLDQSFQELQRDLTYLQRLWESIQQTAASKRAPALVYREHDLVLRNIRDYFTPDIDEIYVDNEEVYERARAFLREVMPGKENVLRLYAGHQPIFSQFNVENQIESIYKRRVPLKSGGSVVLDGTEALTAIDVNSGRSTRGSNQEETAFRTNREAASEIARQLRLRDVGGLIVIDFIDMKTPQHIAEVERTLRQAMREDKARHEVGRISSFGLLEISRQRLRPAAAASSYVACPMCEGYGLIRTTESAALVGLRKIHNRVAKGDVALLRASFPADVGVYLLNHKREDIAQLEKRYGTRIHVVLSNELLAHQSEFEIRARADSDSPEPQRPLRLGGVAVEATRQSSPAEPRAPEPQPVAAADPTAAPLAAEESPVKAEAGAEESGAAAQDRAGRRSRRRRGRRRGRGRQGASGAESSTTSDGAVAASSNGELSPTLSESDLIAAHDGDADRWPAEMLEAANDILEESQLLAEEPESFEEAEAGDSDEPELTAQDDEAANEDDDIAGSESTATPFDTRPEIEPSTAERQIEAAEEGSAADAGESQVGEPVPAEESVATAPRTSRARRPRKKAAAAAAPRKKAAAKTTTAARSKKTTARATSTQPRRSRSKRGTASGAGQSAPE